MGDTATAYRYFALFYYANFKKFERIRNVDIEEAVAKYENKKIKEKIKKSFGRTG